MKGQLYYQRPYNKICIQVRQSWSWQEISIPNRKCGQINVQIFKILNDCQIVFSKLIYAGNLLKVWLLEPLLCSERTLTFCKEIIANFRDKHTFITDPELKFCFSCSGNASHDNILIYSYKHCMHNAIRLCLIEKQQPKVKVNCWLLQV